MVIVAMVAGVTAAFGGCARAPLASETDPTDAGADAKRDRYITILEAGCASVSRSVHQLPADVLIVLDKSGSMRDDAQGNHCMGPAGCGAASKWALVTAALDQVVAMTDSTVNWGLKLFATGNGCGVSSTAEVPVGPMNAPAITSAIAGASLGSRTPTRLAENAGVAYLKGLGDPDPKYLLLATDGLPNCDPAQANTMADDSAGATQAVADAHAAGIPTFVVGVGNTMAEETLNALAQAGGEAQLGAATSFYQVSDTTQLVTALGKILGAIPCTFDLGPPQGQWYSADTITVAADGAVVPHDPSHASGWDFVPGTTSISIYGPTCEAVMSGAITDVTIAFRCGS
jgi:hypothetical protein